MSSVGDASFVCLHIASLVTDVSDVRYAIGLSLGELLCFNVEGMLEFRWVHPRYLSSSSAGIHMCTMLNSLIHFFFTY